MQTQTGAIPNNTGFTATQGTVQRAITVKHTAADNGKMFTDNFGRTYTHTANGNVY